MEPEMIFSRPRGAIPRELVGIDGCRARHGRWLPERCPPFGPRLGGSLLRDLEHDPEKWKPVFRKDHAQTKSMRSAAEPTLGGWHLARRPRIDRDRRAQRPRQTLEAGFGDMVAVLAI